MRRTATFIFFVTLSILAGSAGAEKSDKSPQLEYISRFSGIAVSEMYRSGVPASITLAQGLLESGYGKSELAVKSNNHFGIKCHNSWTGAKVYHDDDAKGECFRKYDDPEDSYRDHSDFLRYRDRYKFLFDYKVTDYKAWAYGLKKAGYATDPSYPEKLIRLIEEYELHVYDAGKKVAVAEEKAVKPKVHKKKKPEVLPPSPSQAEQVKPLTPKQKEEFSFVLSRQMYSLNGVPFVYSVEGETYESIAASHHLFLRELLKFNELDSSVELKPGTVVYLQRKKSQAAAGVDKHVVNEGETLKELSQRYAVRLSRLYKINCLEEEYVPSEGDIIRLRKK